MLLLQNMVSLIGLLTCPPTESAVHARRTTSILFPIIEPPKYAGVYVACYRDLPVLNSAGGYLRQTEYFLLPVEHQ